MHRDNRGYGAELRRGLSSKQLITDLHEQGVPCEEIIEAVGQVFGVSRGAAQLFVLSHPAWVEDEMRRMTAPWEC